VILDEADLFDILGTETSDSEWEFFDEYFDQDLPIRRGNTTESRVSSTTAPEETGKAGSKKRKRVLMEEEGKSTTTELNPADVALLTRIPFGESSGEMLPRTGRRRYINLVLSDPSLSSRTGDGCSRNSRQKRLLLRPPLRATSYQSSQISWTA
jgi:hypothetical protein